MRHIKRFPEPAILKEKQTEWQEKYNAKLDADPHARPDSSKYAHKEIKDTLYAMSYGKCFFIPILFKLQRQDGSQCYPCNRGIGSLSGF